MWGQVETLRGPKKFALPRLAGGSVTRAMVGEPVRWRVLAACALVFLMSPLAQAQEDAGATAVEAGPDAGAKAMMGEIGHDPDKLQALQERVTALEERMVEEGKSNEADRKEGSVIKRKVKELSDAIQFSGFFDVSASTYRNNPNIFDLGSFEFDIKKEFHKYFQVGAALVFADKQADLAVGFIDFHLFGGLIPARGNVFLESGFHLQVGKFDVPFGNDWQYFASLDRPTMSAPLTTTVLMGGGYNDVGFRVLGNHRFINYAGYLLKGTGDGVAAGGRLAFVPFNNPFTMRSMDAQPLDVGVSYLHDYSQTGTTEQRTFATDVEARFEFLRLQFEYYLRRDLVQGVVLEGYQASLFGSFLESGPLPFGLSSRYDAVHSKSDEGTIDQHLRRITLAGFLRPFDVTVLKLEYLHYLSSNELQYGDAVCAQLVIGFK